MIITFRSLVSPYTGHKIINRPDEGRFDFELRNLFNQSDGFDFNIYILGQAAHLYTRPGRGIIPEIRAIHLVNLAELLHVLDKDGTFDAVIKVGPGLIQDRLYILQTLFGLFLDILGNQLARAGAKGNLP